MPHGIDPFCCSVRPSFPIAGSRQQAAGSRQQAAGSRQQAAGSRQQAAGSRQQAAGSRQQAAGSRQQAAGSRQQAAGSRQQAAGSRQVPVHCLKKFRSSRRCACCVEPDRGRDSGLPAIMRRESVSCCQKSRECVLLWLIKVAVVRKRHLRCGLQAVFGENGLVWDSFGLQVHALAHFLTATH